MATPFTFETVDEGISAQGAVSLALDGSGNSRIAYTQQGSGQIVVARRDGGAWTKEQVSSGFVGLDSSLCLAIDSQGNPQLAYRDLNSSELIHAVKGADRWVLTHIRTRLGGLPRPGGVDGIAFALHPGRLDRESRDVGYFVYTDLVHDGIGFAHTGNLGPTPVTVQEDQNDLLKFGHSSATFDPSENFFVGYIGFFRSGSSQDTVSVRSTHITNIETGTFADPTVIESSPFINVKRSTSIVRTFGGGCLAYFDIANKTLKARVSSVGSGVERIETVAANINAIVTPSAAQNRGAFRVAFADTDAIKLASRSQSGNWTVEIVDGVSGGTPSVAYDNSGKANIAYAVGGKLKYATRTE